MQTLWSNERGFLICLTFFTFCWFPDRLQVDLKTSTSLCVLSWWNLLVIMQRKRSMCFAWALTMSVSIYFRQRTEEQCCVGFRPSSLSMSQTKLAKWSVKLYHLCFLLYNFCDAFGIPWYRMSKIGRLKKKKKVLVWFKHNLGSWFFFFFFCFDSDDNFSYQNNIWSPPGFKNKKMHKNSIFIHVNKAIEIFWQLR